MDFVTLFTVNPLLIKSETLLTDVRLDIASHLRSRVIIFTKFIYLEACGILLFLHKITRRKLGKIQSLIFPSEAL